MNKDKDMRIITWDDRIWQQCDDGPVATRIRPNTALLHPREVLVNYLKEDTEHLILPSAFTLENSNEQAIAYCRVLGGLLPRLAPSVKTVWFDHPPNAWTVDAERKEGRRSAAALNLFRQALRGLIEASGMRVAACQYGVNGTPMYGDIPLSPVLWTVNGTNQLASSAERFSGMIMPWVRGIGQWAPNAPAPTMRSFLHDLLTCWRVGASSVLVWSDPSNTTDRQIEQMAACIDITNGLKVEIVPNRRADDMDSLLRTLAGGGDFSSILDTLAAWGGSGGGDHDDPDHPDSASQEVGRE